MTKRLPRTPKRATPAKPKLPSSDHVEKVRADLTPEQIVALSTQLGSYATRQALIAQEVANPATPAGGINEIVAEAFGLTVDEAAPFTRAYFDAVASIGIGNVRRMLFVQEEQAGAVH